MNPKWARPGKGGGYSVEHIILKGGPTYRMPMPGIPVSAPRLHRHCRPTTSPRTPLIPTDDEVAQLPRLARVAFAERCALRVKPVRPDGIASAADAARAIFETATIDSPLTSQLRCIRRDFVRLKKFARKEKWTDDTNVPADVFGPMWPDDVEPYWAVEPPQPGTPPEAECRN